LIKAAKIAKRFDIPGTEKDKVQSTEKSFKNNWSTEKDDFWWTELNLTTFSIKYFKFLCKFKEEKKFYSFAIF